MVSNVSNKHYKICEINLYLKYKFDAIMKHYETFWNYDQIISNKLINLKYMWQNNEQVRRRLKLDMSSGMI